MLFGSKKQKLRKQAEDWARLADKIYNYRRDVLEAGELEELVTRRAEVRRLRKLSHSTEHEIHAACEDLEQTLKRVGGVYYPRDFWSENVEVVLVAAILAIGLRTFFLQPFKIPTNSMYPTYYGMTHEILVEDEGGSDDGLLKRIVDYAVFGASQKEVVAPTSGELFIPIVPISPEARAYYEPEHYSFRRPVMRGPARPNWPVFKGLEDTYLMFVDDDVFEIKVPGEFGFGEVVADWLEGRELRDRVVAKRYRGRAIPCLQTGIRVSAGERIMKYRLYTGDQLFVDRVSYHFLKPEVGAPFVFTTDEIPGIDDANRGKYYIKRLVGTEGDTLEVRPPVLHRNGKPIDGAEAFLLNAVQEEDYSGYTIADNSPRREFRGDEPIRVPEDSFFAMGDNSPDSSDSRFWGFVPEESVVGRALFIYYPFSKRWGPSE